MAFTPGFERTLSVKVESEGVGGFTDGLDGAIGKLGAFKTAVGVAGGALAAFSGGALATATSAAADFEQAMVEVEKVTSEATAAALSTEIRELARRIPIAQNELAKIAATAGRLGVSGTENIREFTEVTAKMAEATDLASEEAADAFARMSTLMELPIQDVEKLGSAINELSNNMAASAGEIVDAATRSSGVLTQLGLSSETILSLNGAMNEVSASSRLAGTQLRRFAQEIRDPGKVQDLAGALGMTAEEFKTMRSESPLELIEQMVSAFAEGGEKADLLRSTLGTTSRQTLSKLAQNWSSVEEGVEMANEQFTEATSLQREFEAATSTFNAKMRQTMNILRDNAIAIGNVLLPHLTDLLTRVNEFLRSGDSLLGQLSAQEKAWGLVGGAVAGVGLLLAGFVSGPLGAAVAGAAALGYAWKTNLGGIREATRQDVGAVVSTFQKARAILLPTVRSTLGQLQTAWRTHGAGIVRDVRWAFTQVVGVVRSVLTFLTNNLILPLLKRLTKVWNTHLGDLVDEYVATFDHVMKGARKFAKFFDKIWSKWGDEVLAVARFALDAVVGIVGFAFDAMLTNIRFVLALIRGDWKGAFRILRNFARRTLNGIVSFVSTWGTGFAATLANGVDVAVSRAKGLLFDFKTFVFTALEDVTNAIGSTIKESLNQALGLPYHYSIPDVEVGGETVFDGADLKIPALAEGGVVTGPTLAMVGEAGPEAVVPLDKMGDVGGGGVRINRLTIHASGREEGRAAAKSFTDELRSHGFR